MVNPRGTKEEDIINRRERIMDAVDVCDATLLDNLLKTIEDISKPHLDFTSLPPNAHVPRRTTPLKLAAIKGHKGIAEQLICAGASVDFTGDVDDDTPLMLAAMDGHKDICLLLLHHGADINLQTDCKVSQPKTALYFAAWNGESEIVSLLLNHEAELCNFQLSWNDHHQAIRHLPIAAAITAGYPRTTRIFLDHYTKQDFRLPLETLFNLGLLYGGEECLIVVLQQGYYPIDKESNEFNFWSCFYKACRSEMIKLASLLLELNPRYMQDRWLVMKSYPKGLTQHSDFIPWLTKCRKYPPSLAKMCKSMILSQLGSYYMSKIKLLPLPTALKTFLSSLLSSYGQE